MTAFSTFPRRLPLPPHIALLSEAQEPALAQAKTFVERLCALRLDSWLAIGRAVTGNRGSAAYTEAWTAVNLAIAQHKLGFAAWRVRDDIETLAYLTSRCGRPLLRGDRPVFAAAHGAAEDAALALLVREHVSPAQVALLCAPFATQAWLDKRFDASPSRESSESVAGSGDSTESPGTRMLNTLPPASRSA